MSARARRAATGAADGTARDEALVERLLEREAQLPDAGARPRGGRERAVQRVGEKAREIPAPARERLNAPADAPCGGGGSGAAHGVDPAEGLVQDEGERVEVGLLAHLAPLGLLGGHVGERPEDVAGAREDVLAGEAGATEVGQLGGRVVLLGRARDEHVLGLDVAVYDAAAVGVGEGAGERDPDLEHLLVGEALLGDQAPERLALDELGDQVHGAVLGARLVQGDDRRMAKARGDERLAHRPLAVPARAEGDALERHLAVQELVVGAPHHAEAARPEAVLQAVAPEHQLGRPALAWPGVRATMRWVGGSVRIGGSPRGRAAARSGGAPGPRAEGEEGCSSVRCDSTGLRVRRRCADSLHEGLENRPG